MSRHLSISQLTLKIVLLFKMESALCDNHWGNLLLYVDEHYKAREEYSLLIEIQGLLYSQPDQIEKLSATEQAVVDMEKVPEDKRKVLRKYIRDFSAGGAGYKEIVELIMI